MKLITKIFFFPIYIQDQIWLRGDSESAKNWNKWQPTKSQSLSEYIDYNMKYSPIPTNKIAKSFWKLMIAIIILISLILLR